MSVKKPTAIVYVDGLSLFYRKLKGNNHLKWLDLEKMTSALYPDFELIKVKYFTAIAKQIDGDSEIGIRQSLYLRALESQSKVLEISKGYIRIDNVRLPKAPKERDESGQLIMKRVYRFEEKETDVRIAMAITIDSLGEFADKFVLISGDKDFEPLRELFLNQPDRFQILAPQSIPEKLLMASQLKEGMGSTKPRDWLT